MEKMCTLLIPTMGLLQHGIPYSFLMTVLSVVFISIQNENNEQQEDKVIPVLVRIQTCLVQYNFHSNIFVSAAFCNVLFP